MKVIKFRTSYSEIITLSIEESTLSDGSHAYAVRIGSHLLQCISHRDALKAFGLIDTALLIIEP